ncbi:MAG: hypothetical protein KGH69_04385 [Candidatus Micrarchaeota archaeon]|nr:hypothetical protein [Candidatus Micrarchaeota archaeon]
MAKAMHVATRLEHSANGMIARGELKDRMGTERVLWRLDIAIALRRHEVENARSPRKELAGLRRSADAAETAAKVVDVLMYANGLLGNFSIAMSDPKEGSIDFTILGGDPINAYHRIGIAACERIAELARKSDMEYVAEEYERKAMQMWLDRARAKPNVYDLLSYMPAKEIAESLGDSEAVHEIEEAIINSCGSYATVCMTKDPFNSIAGFKMAIDYAAEVGREDLETRYRDRMRSYLDILGSKIKPASDDAEVATICAMAATISRELGYDDHARRFGNLFVASKWVRIERSHANQGDGIPLRISKILHLTMLLNDCTLMGLPSDTGEIRREIESLKRLSIE